MKELLIYRNDRLHCIITEDKAEATMELLQNCFQTDAWELREKPEKKEETEK